MIVIPEHCRILLVGIVIKNRLARRDPVFRIAIALRWRSCSVQVRNGPYLWFVSLGSVKSVIDGQEVLLRQLVRPFNQQAIPAARLNRRPRNRKTEGPTPGRLQVAVDLHYCSLRCKAVAGQLELWGGRQGAHFQRLRDCRHRQRVHEGRQAVYVERVRRCTQAMGHCRKRT